MKYILSIVLLLCMSLSLFAHDVPVANFNLKLEGTCLSMTITIDKADLKKACKIKGKLKRLKQAERDQIITDYLEEHLQLVVNQKELKLAVDAIESDHHHFEIQAVYEGDVLPIESIVMKNTCLLEEEEKQSNVITIDIDGKVRGFRMTAERRRIQVDY